MSPGQLDRTMVPLDRVMVRVILWGSGFACGVVAGRLVPAENFAANLEAHGVPFHLWAKTKSGAGWSTTQKPSVVLDALDAYPGKTVVLMNVDCIVNGDVAPVAEVAGDVGICAIAMSMEGRKGLRHWLAFETSSRVIVFNPTDAGRMFAKRWAAKIAASDFPHDEWALSWGFLSSPDVRFDYLD
jgi:hypothetical protein